MLTNIDHVSKRGHDGACGLVSKAEEGWVLDKSPPSVPADGRVI